MNDSAVQITLFLLIMLPFSLFFLGYLVVACGWLRDVSDQPRWIRFVMSRAVPRFFVKAPSTGGALLAIAFLALFNWYAVALLALAPLGSTPFMIDLAYFVVLGAFLFPVVRAIVRERARNRGR
jgi:hypothetical protein